MPAALPRVVIENVAPRVDGGRHPVKRVVGDVVRVEADIFKDGHDLVAARVLYRPEGDRAWQQVPLEYEYDSERWRASLTVDRLGLWQFAIQAWPDRLGTWRDGVKKRHAAGQDVAVDLLEGAALLRKGLRRFPAATRKLARAAAARLADTSAPLPERLAAGLSEELYAALYGPLSAADATRAPQVWEVLVERKAALFATWYELFPRSQATEDGKHGTFADAERRLPELAALGFDVVYLPPIHPIGRVHRKGRNNAPRSEPGDVGSPWAIGSAAGGHTAVHSRLGTIDDFNHFVAAARKLGLEVALDYALQCAPDHPWTEQHPEWFHIRADGSIRYAENPPKRYEDIYPLNFWCPDRVALWQACRDILLFWIEHGVRTFRVDNPHTKPLAFWEWMLHDVRRRHPDVIFLAEAFTRPKRMCALAKVGFSQSYSYFAWKNTAYELTEFASEYTCRPRTEYYRPNLFTNTPDILHEYLQQGGRPAFRIRLLLAGTLSPLYGIYSGYELCENTPLRPGSEEYLDAEKYEIRTRDWDAPGNIKEDIAVLNRLRREYAALRQLDNMTFLRSDHDQILAFRKTSPAGDLLTVVNLDPDFQPLPLAHVPGTLLHGVVSGSRGFHERVALPGVDQGDVVLIASAGSSIMAADGERNLVDGDHERRRGDNAGACLALRQRRKIWFDLPVRTIAVENGPR